MSDDMKPCPFCGQDVCTVQQSFQCEYVQCDRCEAMGPAGKTTDDAIAEWNRRLGDPKDDGDEGHFRQARYARQSP